MNPILERLAQKMPYSELKETWMIPDIDSFSPKKSLYEYQIVAVKNAASVLYLYKKRQKYFKDEYENSRLGSVKKYEQPKDLKVDKRNPVYSILAEYFRSVDDEIFLTEFINRMCFWMATGSGKTLVMIKMIEYLYCLIKHGEIEPYNILILAPSEQLLRQIKQTVDEFNQSGLYIDLVPLREIGSDRQGRLGDRISVYYHRSDLISDIQKESLTDFRRYQNEGKWYVFLDEAHKGDKEDSKRQAYYAIMARKGFLFNFSATFTEDFDIATTVAKYNLEEFVQNGYGKNILLSNAEYSSFKRKQGYEIDFERQKIVLKSLITLSFVSLRVKELRMASKSHQLYHQPLMLTLVNSVNTTTENEKNDLWEIFQTLRQLAGDELEESLFLEAKKELLNDWLDGSPLFSPDQSLFTECDQLTFKKLTKNNLRKLVFHSNERGAIQSLRSTSNKELALQLKNADSPFALIRIADTKKWHDTLLVGYEQTTTVQETSFFERLEHSPITILMGSRSFFESWDSNRPNVINFVNIGGREAKKFVIQSVGRGVRIELLPNKRRRLAHLSINEKLPIDRSLINQRVWPVETLFLYATDRNAFEQVFEVLKNQQDSFKVIDGIEKTIPPLTSTNQLSMALLVPDYKDTAADGNTHPFSLSLETYERYKLSLQNTSNSVLIVRDGSTVSQISALREIVDQPTNFNTNTDKSYKQIEFLHSRLLSHLERIESHVHAVRSLVDNDIVHFCHVQIHEDHWKALQDIINRVAKGEESNEKIQIAANQLGQGKISREEFNSIARRSNEETYRNLHVKNVAQHYYCPIVLGSDTAEYIRHIIKIPSEVEFLTELETWHKSNDVDYWDSWMFSKIDEALDNIYIPYYDEDKNMDRKFYPDFVFWMSKLDFYQIVFVDPKSTQFRTDFKINGYKKLFESDGNTRFFRYGSYKVAVRLLCYNKNFSKHTEFSSYWTSEIGTIFEPEIFQGDRDAV